MLSNSISSRGGARIGWINATWPFANLTATHTRLVLNATLIGEYSFAPEQVIGIEIYGSIPLIGRGIKIHHNIPDYPKMIIFWCFESPQKLIRRIEDTGFLPNGSPDSMPDDRGMPVRWPAIVAIVVLWNLLFLVDMTSSNGPKQQPGLFSLLATSMLFLGSVGIWHIPLLQRLILKPGRSPNEIKAWLYLLALISGFLSFFMLLINFGGQ